MLLSDRKDDSLLLRGHLLVTVIFSRQLGLVREVDFEVAMHVIKTKLQWLVQRSHVQLDRFRDIATQVVL